MSKSYPLVLDSNDSAFQDFPNKYISRHEDAMYQQYLIVGKDKKDGKVRQYMCPRISKYGIEGGIGSEGLDITHYVDDYAIYYVRTNSEYIKLSKEQAEKILRTDIAWNKKDKSNAN